MKVTIDIDDELINEIKTYTNSSTITESITVALKDCIDTYQIKK